MKAPIRHLLLCLLVIAGLQFVSALALAADSAGMVLSVVNGAWLERGGQKQAVQSKDTVLVNDIVSTDGQGKVQILFNDNTVVAIGNNSSIAIADFVFDEAAKKASFSAKMTQGIARFVTGKVVERNRDGFSVKTPSATVGIRGTTFAVEVSSAGVTDVIGLSINPAFPVSVTNSTTGTTDVIDKNGLAVKAASAGNTSYMAPAGKLASLDSAVKINGGNSASDEKTDEGEASSSKSDKKAAGSSEEQSDSEDNEGGSEGGSSDSGSDSGSGSGGGSEENGSDSASAGGTTSSSASSATGGAGGSGSASASPAGGSGSLGGSNLGGTPSDGGVSTAAAGGSSGVMPSSALRLVASIPSPATEVVSPDKTINDIPADLILNADNNQGSTTPGGGTGGTGGSGGSGGGLNPPINPPINSSSVHEAKYSGTLTKTGNPTAGTFSFNFKLTPGTSKITDGVASYTGGANGVGVLQFTQFGNSSVSNGGDYDLILGPNAGVTGGTHQYNMILDGKMSSSNSLLSNGHTVPSGTDGDWTIKQLLNPPLDSGDFSGTPSPLP